MNYHAARVGDLFALWYIANNKPYHTP